MLLLTFKTDWAGIILHELPVAVPWNWRSSRLSICFSLMEKVGASRRR